MFFLLCETVRNHQMMQSRKEGMDMSVDSAGKEQGEAAELSSFAMEESTAKGAPQLCVPNSDLDTWFPLGFPSH